MRAFSRFLPVIPAKAGIQFWLFCFEEKIKSWIPAFAGMTR
ncbi:hypothetical protein [Thermomonas brevis]|nr:hypothetical protein [Thermomonas brevis]